MSPKQARLPGFFNDWDPTETPMVRDEEGHWTTSLKLAPGRYEYKFVVDCSHCMMNDFGTMNRVLAVP